MPFSNRDRQRPSDRLRGKSSQEFIDEFNSAFGSRSPRMLFDTAPWSTRTSFPRGFPFDDDSDEEGSSRFRTRNRRPSAQTAREFFTPSGIHEPPWGEDRKPPKKRVVEPEQEEPPSAPSLNQHGLRNTVPLAQAPKFERLSRAMSAPPGDRTQPRYTSTCEIPVMGTTSSTPPKPPTNQQQSTNNVRVIPIQVEGRDEPLINANIDTASNFATDSSKFDGRLPRDFGAFRKHSSRFQQKPPSPQQQQQQQTVDETDKGPAPAPSSSQQQQQQLDPTAQALARINEIQLKVEELAKQVEAAQVTSRKDKEYVILDEMLTVQLLHLDNVDPEGHDNVRQARKDAIRAIQKCISILESKVPVEQMQIDKPNETPESAVEEQPKSEPDTQMDTSTPPNDSQPVPETPKETEIPTENNQQPPASE